MFENIIKFFKKLIKTEERTNTTRSKDTAKERLHLVLMQDRANVSADFLELMKQEIIEVIKKYIEVDEELIDVRLTNQMEEDGVQGSPALYANIPIINLKKDYNKNSKEDVGTDSDKEEKKEEKKETSDKKENKESKGTSDKKENKETETKKEETLEEKPEEEKPAAKKRASAKKKVETEGTEDTEKIESDE